MDPYQVAAQAVYEPQKTAEANSLKATHDTTVNSLNLEKGQVATNYQAAIDQLTQSVKDQGASINQLYTQRLGGNFSGLQGNDLGGMYSRANSQQAVIESTRANKLSQITGGITNADINYNTDIANLTPKYQSLEANAANSSRSADAKAAQAQSNSDRSYNLSVAKFNQSSSNSSTAAADKIASQYKAKQATDGSGDYQFIGPNGQPVSLAEYADKTGKNTNDILDFLKNGSAYDKKIYNSVNIRLQNKKIANDPTAILKAIAQGDGANYYGLR